jgi:hypothetical protein
MVVKTWWMINKSELPSLIRKPMASHAAHQIGCAHMQIVKLFVLFQIVCVKFLQIHGTKIRE